MFYLMSLGAASGCIKCDIYYSVSATFGILIPLMLLLVSIITLSESFLVTLDIRHYMKKTLVTK